VAKADSLNFNLPQTKETERPSPRTTLDKFPSISPSSSHNVAELIATIARYAAEIFAPPARLAADQLGTSCLPRALAYPGDTYSCRGSAMRRPRSSLLCTIVRCFHRIDGATRSVDPITILEGSKTWKTVPST